MDHSILYLIRSTTHDLHKIGVTNNWSRRKQQLEVGLKAETIHVASVGDADSLERALHRRFQSKRLPQSEWFELDQQELDYVRTTIHRAAEAHQATRLGPVRREQHEQPDWYKRHLAQEEAESQARQLREAAVQQRREELVRERDERAAKWASVPGWKIWLYLALGAAAVFVVPILLGLFLPYLMLFLMLFGLGFAILSIFFGPRTYNQ